MKKKIMESIKNMKSIYQGPTRYTPVGESATKQAFKDETDIHKIIARFTKETLQGPPLSERNFGDFSDVPDLKGLYERIETAQESFSMLPSKVRLKFNGDPLEFMEFASNPDNLDAMRELGLAKPAQATPAVEPSEAAAE